ncbi:hypothetical protein [Burkholderia ubonensis]|uniref:hypothetical protein n=1 Tax=Burkholderia ubonensis TaxID=101571 RepID=UPI001160902F|nr:hypothetical protein [Burkholderia ubonensis]
MNEDDLAFFATEGTKLSESIVIVMRSCVDEIETHIGRSETGSRDVAGDVTGGCALATRHGIMKTCRIDIDGQCIGTVVGLTSIE